MWETDTPENRDLDLDLDLKPKLALAELQLTPVQALPVSQSRSGKPI